MTEKPISVSILVSSETSPSTLFGLFDVLSSVGVGWEQFVTATPERPRFDVRIVAVSREPVQCSNNVVVSPHFGIDEIESTDVVVVAALLIPASKPLDHYDRRGLEWLNRLQRQGTVITAACTGTLVLAEAGLLDGVDATSHWAYRDLFRHCYPEVQLRLDQNLVGADDENAIVTSGGTTAWQELALHLITRYCGPEYAMRTARFWLIPDREESQAQYAAMPVGFPHNDDIVERGQLWIDDNFTASNPVATLAEQSGLPPTTFARRFKKATGYTPIDYVHTRRIERAKELLSEETHTIEDIGYLVGYEDPASFRRLFKRKSGVTASHYRQRFGRYRFARYELGK